MILNLYQNTLSVYLKILLRLPAYWVPTILFPAMLFMMFGIRSGNSTPISALIMASFTVYAVIGVAFYQFGISIAQQRESRWESFERILPYSFWPGIFARLISAGFFALLSVFLVLAVAFTFSNPDADIFAVIRLVIYTLGILVPFILAGIALGYWSSARASVPIANLIFLPLAYLGGLWVPPIAMGRILNEISQYTPTRHGAEIAWAAVANRPIPLESIVWLACFSLFFAGVAYLGYRRDKTVRYS